MRVGVCARVCVRVCAIEEGLPISLSISSQRFNFIKPTKAVSSVPRNGRSLWGGGEKAGGGEKQGLWVLGTHSLRCWSAVISPGSPEKSLPMGMLCDQSCQPHCYRRAEAARIREGLMVPCSCPWKVLSPVGKGWTEAGKATSHSRSRLHSLDPVRASHHTLRQRLSEARFQSAGGILESHSG